MDVRPARRMLRQGVAGDYTCDRSAPWAVRLTLTDPRGERAGMESMRDKLTHLPNCRFGDEANKLVGSASVLRCIRGATWSPGAHADRQLRRGPRRARRAGQPDRRGGEGYARALRQSSAETRQTRPIFANIFCDYLSFRNRRPRLPYCSSATP